MEKVDVIGWQNYGRRPIAGWYDPNLKCSVVLSDDGAVHALDWEDVGNEPGENMIMSWASVDPVPGSVAEIVAEVETMRREKLNIARSVQGGSP